MRTVDHHSVWYAVPGNSIIRIHSSEDGYVGHMGSRFAVELMVFPRPTTHHEGSLNNTKGKEPSLNG